MPLHIHSIVEGLGLVRASWMRICMLGGGSDPAAGHPTCGVRWFAHPCAVIRSTSTRALRDHPDGRRGRVGLKDRPTHPASRLALSPSHMA
jgi:hypothetical protein